MARIARKDGQIKALLERYGVPLIEPSRRGIAEAAAARTGTPD